MKLSSLRLCAVLVLAGALSACASGGSKGAIEGASGGAPVERPSTRPMQDFSGRDGSSLGGAGDERAQLEAALARNVVYFEFDQATLTSEGQEVVRVFAQYLLSNPAARVRLEGHTDERGSREYNLALGERRAKSVEAALVRAGVSAAQSRVLSYGEERPSCTQSSEDCWQKNRRVEIIRL